MKTACAALSLLLCTMSGLMAQTPPAAPPAAALMLRYKFTPGEVQRYRMTMDMRYAIPPIGKAAPTTMLSHSEIVFSQTVQSISPTDGAATLAAHFESMTVTASGQTHQFTPEELTRFNTGNIMAMVIGPTVMTPTGQVQQAKVGGLPPGAIPGLDMSKGFMTTTGTLPSGPVKVGDAWDGTGASGPLGMQMKMQSTLSGVDTSPTGAGTLADIGQTYSGTFNLGMSAPAGPTHMTGVLSGTGHTHFDTDAGAVADSTSDLQEEMTMALPPAALKSAPAGAPKTIHMSLTMTMKMQRLPAAPAPAPKPTP